MPGRGHSAVLVASTCCERNGMISTPAFSRRRMLCVSSWTSQTGKTKTLAARVARLICACPPNSTGDLAGRPLRDGEYVVLSTIHSAKRCEWAAVFVIHAAGGVIPSDMCDGEDEIEEERRLFYLALTRAKDRLYVTWPLRYQPSQARPRGRPQLRPAKPFPAAGVIPFVRAPGPNTRGDRNRGSA
jgi:superfamily I DNA/RNA helicase